MKEKTRLQTISVMVLTVVMIIGFAGCRAGEESTIGIGSHIPDFSLNDETGNVWNLSRNLDKYLVVYFYPAAMTGGCTLQACSYRDNREELQEMGVNVVGISGDSVNNIRIFKDVHELNFTLLSDINGDIARTFGVPVDEGGTFSATVDGEDIPLERAYTTSRWTFILDADGNVIYRNTDVNAGEDSEDVIHFLKTL